VTLRSARHSRANHLRAALMTTCATWLASCGGGPEPHIVSSETCAPAPLPAPAEAFGESPSQLFLEFTLPKTVVDDAVEASVPEVVAEGKGVSAGAAGRVTFEIKRGTPRLSLTETGLVFDVELTGNIRLCKPFGGVCIEYGKCRPEWLARGNVKLPWTIVEEPDVALDVTVTTGCILSPVRYDATRELEKITQEEVSKIRKQLRREVRKRHSEWQSDLAKQGNLLRSSKDDATAVTLDQVALGLAVSNTEYTGALRAVGSLQTLSPEAGSARSPATSFLSPTAQVVALTPSWKETPAQLILPTRVALATLAEQWQASLPGTEVRVTAHGSQLLVTVTPWNNCQQGWAVFQPSITDKAIHLEQTLASDAAILTALTLPPALSRAAQSHHGWEASLKEHLRSPYRLESKHTRTALNVTFEEQLDVQHAVRVENDALVFSSTAQGPLRAKLDKAR
jgi:hypothetical protein